MKFPSVHDVIRSHEHDVLSPVDLQQFLLIPNHCQLTLLQNGVHVKWQANPCKGCMHAGKVCSLGEVYNLWSYLTSCLAVT